MSANPNSVDEDKLTILLKKTAERAQRAKDEYTESVALLNQLRGICKSNKGEMPISALTKKPITEGFRKIIFDECKEAASRLNIS